MALATRFAAPRAIVPMSAIGVPQVCVATRRGFSPIRRQLRRVPRQRSEKPVVTRSRRPAVVVESYPQDTEGKKTPASLLYDATRRLLRAGLHHIRGKGLRDRVMP